MRDVLAGSESDSGKFIPMCGADPLAQNRIVRHLQDTYRYHYCSKLPLLIWPIETSKRQIVDRLTKAQSKICIELDREREQQEIIQEQLQNAELDLEKAILQRTKVWLCTRSRTHSLTTRQLSELEDDLKRKETEMECFQQFYAQNRIEMEETNAKNTINKVKYL